MTAAEIIAATRAYVVENFLYMRPNVAFADDESLLTSGIIDSLGVVELVEFAQDAFRVEVPEGDITEANFATLARIARYVLARRGATESAT